MTSESSARLQLTTEIPIEYLTEIPGFDAAAAVDSAYLSYPWADKSEFIKYYAQRAPFWTASPLGRSLILRIFCAIWDIPEVSPTQLWILRVLPEADHAIVHRVTADLFEHHRMKYGDHSTQDALFSLTHVYALENLPTCEGARLVKERLRLEKSPPIESRHVHAASYGVHRAESCERMTLAFLRILWGLPPELETEDAEDVIRQSLLVRLHGHLIGIIKGEGMSSMLALRNVCSPDGRLMLALGGVYQVSPAHMSKDYATDPAADWSVADVDKLAVKPLSFLLNAECWHLDVLPDIQSIMGLKIEGIEWEQSRRFLHRNFWEPILDRIEKFRLKVAPHE